MLQSVNNEAPGPGWTQKKRVIPNHLVPKKKTGFTLLTDSTTKKNTKNSLVSTDLYNILSFRRKNEKPNYDTTMDLTLHNDNESIYEESNFGEDLPPTRSIHDLNHISTPSKPSQIELIINKDPNQFENVFNRNAPKETPPKSINSSESAVLVFGYPESISDLVIQHFREFGEFLEKFDNNNKKHSSNSISLNNKKIVPIFVGKNWLKLTFKNSDAASQALLENGIVFNGSILGVIPYSKEAIEKLQKRKLTDEEDFGTNDLKSVKKEPLNNSISSNIDIKDGTKFFLKASDDKVTNKSENSNLTWYEKITKALFGFHEL